MSKRTVFTTVTPVPAGISRQTVMETLWNHVEMIDLNPIVEKREPCKPPPNSAPEEYSCQWYEITHGVNFLPKGLYKGKIVFTAAFHDLPEGLQTHIYAPMGLEIKGKWSLGGSLPGEPRQPTELGLGAPKEGLYLREDVDMRCNILMTSFVKKNIKDSHGTLVQRLIEKSHNTEAIKYNQNLMPQPLSPAPTWTPSPVEPSPHPGYNPNMAPQYAYPPPQPGQYPNQAQYPGKEQYQVPQGQAPPYAYGAAADHKAAELE